MNVIKRGGKAGGGVGRGVAPTSKRDGRGKDTQGFEIIQHRPTGPTISSSSTSAAYLSSGTRTPSNLELDMAIRCTPVSRKSLSSYANPRYCNTVSAPLNLFSMPAPASTHGSNGRPAYLRTTSSSGCYASSESGTSASTRTPVYPLAPPKTLPKTPRNISKTAQNMMTPKTPRTTPASTSATSVDRRHSHVILSVTEGRGQARGEVGMAVIDVTRPQLLLCQLSDSQTYSKTLTKIQIFNPSEILVPNTFVESTHQSNKLYNLIQEQFHSAAMTKVQRRHYQDSVGLQQIQHLCLQEYASCQLLFQEKFYALAAVAALLKYVEYIKNVIFAPQSLKIEYQGAEHGAIIDVKTARGLELLLTQGNERTENTLIKLMDHCCTHGGKRLLRASLLHPPSSFPFITRRQDSVQEVVQRPELAQKIRNALEQLHDVDRLLTLCMQTPSNLDNNHSMEMRHNYVLLLKVTLDVVPQLVTALGDATSHTICKARQSLQDPRFAEMKTRILKTIHEDVKLTKSPRIATFQRCFAVKSGLSELLDVVRRKYSEIVDDMHVSVLHWAKEFSLPLRLSYSVTRGYYIQIPVQRGRPLKQADLPPIFIQVHCSRNTVTCTTNSLLLADERINAATQEILCLSNVLLTSLLADIRQHISCIYQLCENVAELDLISSLAQVSCNHNYVRPSFKDIMFIKKGRHPILDNMGTCDPVANDIEASGFSNLKIITGPNMSGKSVYIKQVLLLQIMAQVGCYVPAEEATFRITDRIFSHLSFDDSIENNASTLALEMRETQLMLSCITATSLIALDEICCGTSVEEGTAVAWAICEELSQQTAFAFVTTHFKTLTQLASVYPCITNIHLEAIERELHDGHNSLIYTHRLLPGATTVEHYGLRLAEAYGLPVSVVENARKLSGTLHTLSKDNLVCTDDNEDWIKGVLFHKLRIMAEEGKVTLDNAKDIRHEREQKIEIIRQKNRVHKVHSESEDQEETPTLNIVQNTNDPPTANGTFQNNNYTNTPGSELVIPNQDHCTADEKVKELEDKSETHQRFWKIVNTPSVTGKENFLNPVNTDKTPVCLVDYSMSGDSAGPSCSVENTPSCNASRISENALNQSHISTAACSKWEYSYSDDGDFNYTFQRTVPSGISPSSSTNSLHTSCTYQSEAGGTSSPMVPPTSSPNLFPFDETCCSDRGTRCSPIVSSRINSEDEVLESSYFLENPLPQCHDLGEKSFQSVTSVSPLKSHRTPPHTFPKEYGHAEFSAYESDCGGRPPIANSPLSTSYRYDVSSTRSPPERSFHSDDTKEGTLEQSFHSEFSSYSAGTPISRRKLMDKTFTPCFSPIPEEHFTEFTPKKPNNTGFQFSFGTSSLDGTGVKRKTFCDTFNDITKPPTYASPLKNVRTGSFFDFSQERKFDKDLGMSVSLSELPSPIIGQAPQRRNRNCSSEWSQNQNSGLSQSHSQRDPLGELMPTPLSEPPSPIIGQAPRRRNRNRSSEWSHNQNSGLSQSHSEREPLRELMPTRKDCIFARSPANFMVKKYPSQLSPKLSHVSEHFSQTTENSSDVIILNKQSDSLRAIMDYSDED